MLNKGTALQEYNLQSLPDSQLKNSKIFGKNEEPKGVSFIHTPVADGSRKLFGQIVI